MMVVLVLEELYRNKSIIDVMMHPVVGSITLVKHNRNRRLLMHTLPSLPCALRHETCS
jgi:hypothetical protein